jgi:hypothetical protein
MQFMSFDPQKRHNNSQVPCSVCLWYSFALTVQNPFGSAKPREEVIAKRTGKDEATIVAEAAKEYQVKVRLTPEQYAQKQACLQEITTLKETLATEPEDADEVQVRVTSNKQQQHPQQMCEAQVCRMKEFLMQAQDTGWQTQPHQGHRHDTVGTIQATGHVKLVFYLD